MNHPLAKVLDKQKDKTLNYERSYHFAERHPSLPFPVCEVIGDSIRVLAEPTELAFEGRQLILRSNFDDGKVCSLAKIWPAAGRSWKSEMRIPFSGRAHIAALAAAATVLAKAKKTKRETLNGVQFEWENGIQAMMNHPGALRMRMDGSITEGAKKIAFNPQYLLEALNPKGETRIRFDSETYPALIDDPASPDKWQILLMPLTHY